MMLTNLMNGTFTDVLELFGDGFFPPIYERTDAIVMKTDVREMENSYEVDVDLPGFKKEDVSLQLENDYLTISAAKQLSEESSGQKGKFIRRERYEGTHARILHIGNNVKNDEISAKLEDGILRLTLPKKNQAEIEQSKFIPIA